MDRRELSVLMSDLQPGRDLLPLEARWPGTRERLACDLLLYTGLRRGDAVRVGRQHERDGVITIRTEKHRKGKLSPAE